MILTFILFLIYALVGYPTQCYLRRRWNMGYWEALCWPVGAIFVVAAFIPVLGVSFSDPITGEVIVEDRIGFGAFVVSFIFFLIASTLSVFRIFFKAEKAK
ncbi:MAG: hypothetical protein EA370_05405 [Wenzhouxiangella sp.]|nr:MAG: hypothetical protein EA370_05405 [Wenzhouxiangella sp.]